MLYFFSLEVNSPLLRLIELSPSRCRGEEKKLKNQQHKDPGPLSLSLSLPHSRFPLPALLIYLYVLSFPLTLICYIDILVFHAFHIHSFIFPFPLFLSSFSSFFPFISFPPSVPHPPLLKLSFSLSLFSAFVQQLRRIFLLLP